MTLFQRIGFYVREPRFEAAVLLAELAVCIGLIIGIVEALCVIIPIMLGY